MKLNNLLHALVGIQTISLAAASVFFPDSDAEVLKLAVARPFSVSDIETFSASFDSWDAFPPCGDVSPVDSAHSHSTDLFLVYSQSLEDSPTASDAVASVLDRFSANEGWGHCFNDIFAVSVGIDSDLDIYSPDEQDSNALWVNGPNRHFEKTFRLVQQRGYDALFLMESDSVPLRPSWLNSLVSNSQDNTPFAMLGSTYQGDKWDGFYKDLPKALTHHINGNAIYNLTSPAINHLVTQLEMEALGDVPYDLRISELALANAEYLKGIKETPFIANYAATNILPSHISPEAVIVHGASVYAPLNEELALVISSWEDPDATIILSHLEDGNHPFSRIVLMVPPGASDLPLLNKTPSIPIDIYHRNHDEMDYMDLCNAPVSTKYFMITNAYYRLRANVTLMQTADGTGRPVIPFAPATDEYCYNFPSCREIMQHVNTLFPDDDGATPAVIQDFDMIFDTSHRDEMCTAFMETYGVAGRRRRLQQVTRQDEQGNYSDSSSPAIPSATLYTAYLTSQGLDEDLYHFSDMTLFGSRPTFVGTKNFNLGGPRRNTRRLAESNSTGCLLEVTEDECLGSDLSCEWRPLFSSCYESDPAGPAYHYLQMILDGVGSLSTDAMIRWQESTSSHVANYFNLGGAQDIETVIISQTATTSADDSTSSRKLATTSNTIQYKQRFASESAETKAAESAGTTDVEAVLVSPFDSADAVAAYITLLQDGSTSEAIISAFSSIETLRAIEVVDQPDNLEIPENTDDSFEPTTSRGKRFIGLIAGITGGVVLITTMVALFVWRNRRLGYGPATPVYEIDDSLSSNEMNDFQMNQNGGYDFDAPRSAYDNGENAMNDVPLHVGAEEFDL